MLRELLIVLPLFLAALSSIISWTERNGPSNLRPFATRSLAVIACVVLALSIATVFLRLRLLDPFSKGPWIKEEARRNSKRFLFYILYHFQAFVREEVRDLSMAMRVEHTSKLIRIRNRRRGGGAHHVRWIVREEHQALGFSTEDELFQMLGASPDEIREAVNAYIDTKIQKRIEALEQKAEEQRCLERVERATKTCRRVFLAPRLLWRAFCVWSTSGTLRGVREFFHQLVAEELPQDRKAFCDILRGSTRGVLVNLAESDPEALQKIDSRKALEISIKYEEAREALARRFCDAIRHDQPEPVAVVTAGYSSAVAHCLHRAFREKLVSVVYVASPHEACLRSVRRMIAELESHGIRCATLAKGEVNRRLTRNAVVVVGFEAVTRSLEFCDPDHLLDLFADRGHVPLYTVGECWKVIDLTVEERFRYQKAISTPDGVPAAAIRRDRHAWRTGFQPVDECLLGMMLDWKNRFRLSIRDLESVGDSDSIGPNEEIPSVVVCFQNEQTDRVIRRVS